MSTEESTAALKATEQVHERDAHARVYIADLVGHLEAGDLDSAEYGLRRIAFSELMTNAQALHLALTRLGDAVPVGQLTSPSHPALLLAVAFARREATGRVDALVPLLIAAAAALRKSSGAKPAARARDLTLAALCLDLAQRGEESVQVARRALDLVYGFELAEESDDTGLVGVCAVDLAIILFVNDHVQDASDIWQWVRERTLDPRLPRLMQADWGVSVAGMIVGDRSRISPLVKTVFESDVVVKDSTISPRDAWWAIVATARAWAKLDDARAEDALEITQATIAASPTMLVNGPLAIVHSMALILCNRAISALEFIDRQIAADVRGENGVRTARLASIGIMAAAIGGDEKKQASYANFADHDRSVLSLSQAYSRLISGDLTGSAVLLVERMDDYVAPRWQALYWTLFSAVHARAGHTTMAAEALKNVAFLIERNGLRLWLNLLPQRELDAIRAIAEEQKLIFVLPHLPEQSRITVVAAVALTEREEEILRMIGQGLTNVQIATALFISPNTVKFHVAKLLKRLGVATRDEAVAVSADLIRRSLWRRHEKN